MATAFSVLYGELRNRLNDTADDSWSLVLKKGFINSAINAYNGFGGFRVVTDETTTSSATAVEYTLPATVPNAASIINIMLEQGTDEPYLDLDTYYPQVFETSTGAATTLKLKIASVLPEASKKLRIQYLADYPATLSSDTDSTEVPVEFLYAYAKYLAFDEKVSHSADADLKRYTTAMENALRGVQMHLPKKQRPARRVYGSSWGW